MPEFFQTMMGHEFYQGTMPRIAKALDKLAEALQTVAQASTQTHTAQQAAIIKVIEVHKRLKEGGTSISNGKSLDEALDELAATVGT